MSASEEAVLESIVFLDHFSDLSDPRQLSKYDPVKSASILSKHGIDFDQAQALRADP